MRQALCNGASQPVVGHVSCLHVITEYTDRQPPSQAGTQAGQEDSRTIMRWVICHAADRRKLASVAEQQQQTAATAAPRNVQHSYLYEEV